MSMWDSMYVMVGMCAVVICAAVIAVVWTNYIPAFSAASNQTLCGNVTACNKNISGTTPITASRKVGSLITNGTMDDILFFSFVFLEIVTIILAAGLSSNPISFAVGFVFLIFLVFLATIVSNAMWSVFQQPSLAAAAQAAIPQSLTVIAQMPMWQFFFMGFYCLIIAARSIFWKPEGQPQVVQYER